MADNGNHSLDSEEKNVSQLSPDSVGNDESKPAPSAIENDQTPHLHNIADESEKPNGGSMFEF